MSANAWYAGENWTDAPRCVDPAIRRLCIYVNDRLATDADRERVIGPHLMAPLGTRTDDPDVLRRRAERIVGFAMAMAACALRAYGLEAEAQTLDPFAGVCATGQWAEARVAAYAAVTANAANAAAAAAAAAYVAYAAAAYAAYAAAYAADAAGAANAAENRLLPLILELCAMGTRAEIAQVRALEELPQ
jgi:hypothetical protein